MEPARRLVEDFHDGAAAKKAEEEFEQVFSGRGTPQEMPLFEHAGTEGLIQLLATNGLVSSKSEGRRMVQQGAVSVDGEKVSDFSTELVPRTEEYVVKVGKRRFARVKIGAV